MLLICGVGENSWVPWTARRSNQSVNPRGIQSWIFIGRTDAEAETSMLWPPDAKSWLICKDPDAGKDWRQEEKGMTEDEIAGWHHWLNGQGGLAGCSPWGRKESDTTERLNRITCLIAAITECHTVSGLRKTEMIYLIEIETHRVNNMWWQRQKLKLSSYKPRNAKYDLENTRSWE